MDSKKIAEFKTKLLKDAEKKMTELAIKQPEKQISRAKRFPIIVNLCSSLLSPNQRHYYVINTTNVGVCKYCGEVRNFELNWKRVKG